VEVEGAIPTEILSLLLLLGAIIPPSNGPISSGWFSGTSDKGDVMTPQTPPTESNEPRDRVRSAITDPTAGVVSRQRRPALIGPATSRSSSEDETNTSEGTLEEDGLVEGVLATMGGVVLLGVALVGVALVGVALMGVALGGVAVSDRLGAGGEAEVGVEGGSSVMMPFDFF